jgi:drug/metabolite transporter (DMT)-like permease
MTLRTRLSLAMIGFTAYNHVLKHAPLTAVAMYPYINTVVAVLLGVSLLGEPLTASRVAGSVIILIAAGAMTAARDPVGMAQLPDAGRDPSASG